MRIFRVIIALVLTSENSPPMVHPCLVYGHYGFSLQGTEYRVLVISTKVIMLNIGSLLKHIICSWQPAAKLVTLPSARVWLGIWLSLQGLTRPLRMELRSNVWFPFITPCDLPLLSSKASLCLIHFDFKGNRSMQCSRTKIFLISDYYLRSLQLFFLVILQQHAYRELGGSPFNFNAGYAAYCMKSSRKATSYSLSTLMKKLWHCAQQWTWLPQASRRVTSMEGVLFIAYLNFHLRGHDPIFP